MSYNLKYQVQHNSKVRNNSISYRIDILRKNYGGSVTQLKGDKGSGVFKLITPNLNPKKPFENPIQKGELELFLMVSDQLNYNGLQIVNEILAGQEDTYKMNLYINDVFHFSGFILPDLMEYPEGESNYSISIVAKDLTLMEEKTFPLVAENTFEPIIKIIADCLKQTGLNLPIQTYTNITASSLATDIDENQDFLNWFFHDLYRFRKFSSENEDEPLTYTEVLLEFLRKYNLILRQGNGKWIIEQLPAVAKGDAVQFNYDSNGNYVIEPITNTVDNDGYLQIVDNELTDDLAFFFDSMDDNTLPSEIEEPTTEDPAQETPIENTFDISRVLAVDGEESFFMPNSTNQISQAIKRIEHSYEHESQFASISIDDEIRHDDMSDRSVFSTDVVQDGDIRVKLNGNRIQLLQSNDLGFQTASANVQIRVEGESATRYWSRADNQWTIQQTDIEYQFAGEGFVLSTPFVDVTTTPIPQNLGDSQIIVEFKWGTVTGSGDVEEILFEGFSAFLFTQNNIENSERLDFTFSRDGNYSIVDKMGSSRIGQGVSQFAKGAVATLFNNEITLMENIFRVRGEIEFLSLENLLMRERMNFQRNYIRSLSLNLKANYTINQLIYYKNKLWFPLGADLEGGESDNTVKILQLSYETGDFTDQYERIVVLPEDNTGSSSAGSSVGSGSSGSDSGDTGADVDLDELDNRYFNVNQNLAEGSVSTLLSNLQLKDGSQSLSVQSITINGNDPAIIEPNPVDGGLAIYNNANGRLDTIIALPDQHITSSAVVQHQGNIDHNSLSNYAVNQHRVWENSILQNVHLDNIPTIPNSKLENDSITINTGSGLSNGGSIVLGGSRSISVDSSVARRNATNTFTAINTFNSDVIFQADIISGSQIVIDSLQNAYFNNATISGSLATDVIEAESATQISINDNAVIDGTLTVQQLATFNSNVVLGNQATTTSHPVRADRILTAGNGLTGGGNLTSNRSFTIGTPSTITVSGSNGVSTDSHVHALDLSGRTLTINDDSDSVITWNQNTYNLGANRTWTPTIADHDQNQRGVLSPTIQTIYGNKIFDGEDVVFNNSLSSAGAVSGVSGWQGNEQGNWDFRSITADSLVVQAFTADVAQAFRGSTFLTKSFASIKESFTVPSVGSSTTVTVSEVEGFAGLDVFELNDYLLVQLVDQSNGGLLVGEVWGEVTSAITDNGNGTQSFTFTTRNLSVSQLAGETLHEGNEMLSFGSATDPKGFIQSTVLDNIGSPYTQIVTWSTNPWDRSNWTLRTRTGNLNGINFADGFGLYGENTFLTNSLLAGDLSKQGNYIEYKDGVLTVDGVVRVEGGEIPSQQTIDDIQQAINDFDGLDFGDLAFENVVETAQLGTTIITGGFINTSLINVNDIVASGSIVVAGDGVSDLTNDAGYQTSTDISTAISNFSGTLGGLAFDDLVESAQLGNTVITGGFINTSLINVNDIIASGSIIVSGDGVSDLTNDAGYQNSTDVSTAISNFSGTLGNLAFDDLVQSAQLGETIITGGFINTSLINVDNIIANGSIIVSGDNVSDLTNDSNYQTNTDVSTAISNFSGTLGNLAFDDLVEQAQLGTTIITGGFIDTSLINVDNIIANGSIVVSGDNVSDLNNDSGFQTSSDVSTSITSFGNTLGDLAYDDLVETATLGTTIITGGLIRTSLLDVDNIIASGSIIVSGDNVSDLNNDEGFQTSTQVSTAITNYDNTLGDLAYDDLVETAVLGSTIITGGFIKTDLLDVDDIFSNNIAVSGILDVGSGTHTISGVTNTVSLSNGSFIADDDGVSIDADSINFRSGLSGDRFILTDQTVDPTPDHGGFQKGLFFGDFNEPIFDQNYGNISGIFLGVNKDGNEQFIIGNNTNGDLLDFTVNDALTLRIDSGSIDVGDVFSIDSATNTGNIAGWNIDTSKICQEYEDGEFMTLSTSKTDKSDYRGFSIYRTYNSTGANNFRLLRIGELSGIDSTNALSSAYGIQIGKGVGQVYQDIFRIDSNGEFILRSDFLTIEDGNATFSGDLDAVGGTFSGSLDAVNGTFSGSLVAVNGSLNNLNLYGNLTMGLGGVIRNTDNDYRIDDDGIDFDLLSGSSNFGNTSITWGNNTDVSIGAYETTTGLVQIDYRADAHIFNYGGGTVLTIGQSGFYMLVNSNQGRDFSLQNLPSTASGSRVWKDSNGFLRVGS